MNIQNAIADLQLVGTSVRKINLENTFTFYSDTDAVQKRFDLNYHVGNISKEEDCFWGCVILNLVINISDNEEKEDTKPKSLSFEIEIEGCFTYGGDDEPDFREMLEINGTASVYSIARSMVTTITSQTFNGDKVVLPMLNFFDLANSNESENE